MFNELLVAAEPHIGYVVVKLVLKVPDKGCFWRKSMLGQIGPLQIIIIAVVVILLFGRGKISELMGDVAKGINSFKKGLKDQDEDVASIEEGKDKVVDGVAEKSKTS